VIAYLDASALVKLYVAEPGTDEVAAVIERAEVTGTSVLSRAEVVAALAKATRMRVLAPDAALTARRRFEVEWGSLARLRVTESLMARAGELAWTHGLRGFDAAHLAAAMAWQESSAESVVLVTWDRDLWGAARAAGLPGWPDPHP